MPKLLTTEERVDAILRELDLLVPDAREVLTRHINEAAGVEFEPVPDMLPPQEDWHRDFNAWALAAFGQRWRDHEVDQEVVRVLKKGFRAGWRRCVIAARRRLVSRGTPWSRP